MLPALLRKAAQFFSVLFHPLLSVTYMTALLLIINPYQFGVFSIVEQWKLLALVFVSTAVMPAFALLLMKSLHMVTDFEIKDPKERIGPYIITGVFYLWMFINFKHNPAIGHSLTVGMLGATIALFLIFFVNNFTLISAHAAGMGGLAGVVSVVAFYSRFDAFTIHLGGLGLFEVSSTFVLLLLIVASGAVTTSRLLLHAHSPPQVYSGWLLGFASQWSALLFIG